MFDLAHPGLSFPVLTGWSCGLVLLGLGVSHGSRGAHVPDSPPHTPPIQKERRLLQNRRLDLDASKARLKKAKAAEAKATVGVLLDQSGWRLGAEARGVWHDLPPRPCLEKPGWGALLGADHMRSRPSAPTPDGTLPTQSSGSPGQTLGWGVGWGWTRSALP